MRTEPHPNLDLFWGIKFRDGTHVLEDVPEAGGVSNWFVLQENLDKSKEPVLIKLFKKTGPENNANKSVGVGNGKPTEFFYSKRSSITLGDGSSKENIGIGYHDSTSGKVLISWFDSDLNLVEKEERDIEKCRSIMIPKTTIASSYQNSRFQYQPSSPKQ